MLCVVKEATCYNNIKYFSKQEKENAFVKSQMQSELQSHTACFRRTLHDREVQHERSTQHMENQEAQLRIQFQTEELMMTSLKESSQRNSENDRQAVISAQQLAISLQSEMSQASSACTSWKPRGTKTYHGGGGAKHEEDRWERTPHITHLFIYHHPE